MCTGTYRNFKMNYGYGNHTNTKCLGCPLLVPTQDTPAPCPMEQSLIYKSENPEKCESNMNMQKPPRKQGKTYSESNPPPFLCCSGKNRENNEAKVFASNIVLVLSNKFSVLPLPPPPPPHTSSSNKISVLSLRILPQRPSPIFPPIPKAKG